MVIKRVVIFFCLFMVLGPSLFSQEENRNIEFSGYLSNMQSAMIPYWDGLWITDNLVHNRLNLKWYLSGSFTTNIEVRNRFMYGESMKYIPGYAGLINDEQGWFDLSANLFEGQSYLFHSTIDRFWVDFTKGKLQIRAGR